VINARLYGVRVGLLGALIVLAGGCGAAFAQFSTAASATLSVTTLLLEPPASVSVSSVDGCATMELSWAASPGADSYRVELQLDGGAWTVLTSDTGDVLRTIDSSSRVGVNVRYRLVARHTGSGWESSRPAETTSYQC
jgi:hypothetical protein